RKAVRRERMGHIALTVPVVHIWYFRSLPNKLAYLLGYSSKDLSKIVYYETYVITNPGPAADLGYKRGDLISEDEYFDIKEQFPQDEFSLEEEDEFEFEAKEGA